MSCRFDLILGPSPKEKEAREKKEPQPNHIAVIPTKEESIHAATKPVAPKMQSLKSRVCSDGTLRRARELRSNEDTCTGRIAL